MRSSKILESSEALGVIQDIRSNRTPVKIILCHGVFDLVHPGHVEHFQEAKRLGDILVVSITSDRFVNKGPNRPYFEQSRRASFLAEIELIDFVYVTEADSAVEVINLFKPDYYVKGQDYRSLSDDITGKIELEKSAVESYGEKYFSLGALPPAVPS